MKQVILMASLASDTTDQIYDAEAMINEIGDTFAENDEQRNQLKDYRKTYKRYTDLLTAAKMKRMKKASEIALWGLFLCNHVQLLCNLFRKLGISQDEEMQ